MFSHRCCVRSQCLLKPFVFHANPEHMIPHRNAVPPNAVVYFVIGRAKRAHWNHLWKFISSRPQRVAGKLKSHCHVPKILQFPTIYAAAVETAFSALILWRKAEPTSQTLQSARSDPLCRNAFSPTRQGALRAPFPFVSHFNCV